MGFRIFQLRYETMQETARIEEGITLKSPYQLMDLGFGQIQSLLFTSRAKMGKIKAVHEYIVEDQEDGFKRIKINTSDMADVTKEEGILIIIQQADIVEKIAEVKQLAGRYPGEGVFLLKPNEKVRVTRGKLTEEFAALQFENKMYLVKVHD